MKLSVCIEMVFGDKTFTDRIAKVAQAGLHYFEFWGWPGKDIKAIKKAAQEWGVEPSVFCVKGGALVDPGQKDSYIEGLKETIAVAKNLGVKTLITTTGNEIPGISRDAQHSSIVSTLKAAAPVAEDAGVTLVLEPLNVLVDHKGYYLYSSDEAFRIIDEVGSDNVKLLFDIYHQQITEGHVISRIKANIGKIGHFHVADNPGRNEPGTGELNYGNIFKVIEESGYDRFVGLEYKPTVDPIETLKAIGSIAP